MSKKTISDKSKNVSSEEYKIVGRLKWKGESREYAEEMIATTRESLVVLDMDLRVVVANKAFYQTFEVNPQETRGQLIYDLGNRQWNIPKLRQLLEDILPKNSAFKDFKVEHNFETIGQKTMLLNARRIPRPPAKPRIILLAIDDITELKKIEKENQMIASRYQGLFLASRDAIMTLEPPTWKFTSGNPATLKMFKVKNEADFLFYEPWKLSPKRQPDGRVSSEKGKEMIEIAMHKGSNFFEWVHKSINGEEFYADVLLSRVKTGKKVFLHALVRDITERKKMEQMMIENNKAKDDFLNIAAHDLRTPMSGIRANIEMILEGDYGEIPPKLKRSLQDIHQANLSLIRMVDDFLTISRIEKGKINITPKPMVLVPILNSIVKQMKPLVEKRGLKFDYETPAKLPQVMADSDKIPEVVINLIDNAIKYTNKGSISLKVLAKEDSVVMAVMDTGIGIAQERQKDLFQKYAQVDAEKRIAYGKGTGLGLGLYISRRIIEGCKGKIWVKSEFDKGSTFYFSLPIAKIKKETNI